MALAMLSACSDRAAAPSCAATAAPAMVALPGGRFTLGADPRYPEEGPPADVSVAPFAISRFEVTNDEFAAFVAATGYRTVAERPPPVLPGSPPAMQQPGSAVFVVPDAANPQWWRWVPGANWRHPEGPGSDIKGKGRHPVVQIALEDAKAYARWKGLALPTEAQWEFAARAGAVALPEPVDGDGRPLANYYQGAFPARDLATDGFATLAPVGCFKANGFGLHDMIGNAWELTVTPAAPGSRATIIKGGSYLCASNYCARYRPSARQFQERDLGTNHLGFRLVRNSG